MSYHNLLIEYGIEHNKDSVINQLREKLGFSKEATAEEITKKIDDFINHELKGIDFWDIIKELTVAKYNVDRLKVLEIKYLEFGIWAKIGKDLRSFYKELRDGVDRSTIELEDVIIIFQNIIDKISKIKNRESSVLSSLKDLYDNINEFYNGLKDSFKAEAKDIKEIKSRLTRLISKVINGESANIISELKELKEEVKKVYKKMMLVNKIHSTNLLEIICIDSNNINKAFDIMDVLSQIALEFHEVSKNREKIEEFIKNLEPKIDVKRGRRKKAKE